MDMHLAHILQLFFSFHSLLLGGSLCLWNEMILFCPSVGKICPEQAENAVLPVIHYICNYAIFYYICNYGGS
uniref:Secreted protein n=1 Tax=Picea glauca TaxID=3330 RepID=A0A101LZZ4_PICGL|nr:hypothetical protein ABT39_MTgene4506 [Picea glauca]QHR87421.1 hypothetical protein Q903MT_gene1431 [Picea sitchensis]